jgi:hypothetical protein
VLQSADPARARTAESSAHARTEERRIADAAEVVEFLAQCAVDIYS